jgi:hypothetical protein
MVMSSKQLNRGLGRLSLPQISENLNLIKTRHHKLVLTSNGYTGIDLMTQETILEYWLITHSVTLLLVSVLHMIHSQESKDFSITTLMM